LKITIHRGCNEIGGSCVELQNESDIIFLDFGMPLLEKDGTQFDMKSRVNLTGPIIAALQAIFTPKYLSMQANPLTGFLSSTLYLPVQNFSRGQKHILSTKHLSL